MPRLTYTGSSHHDTLIRNQRVPLSVYGHPCFDSQCRPQRVYNGPSSALHIRPWLAFIMIGYCCCCIDVSLDLEWFGAGCISCGESRRHTAMLSVLWPRALLPSTCQTWRVCRCEVAPPRPKFERPMDFRSFAFCHWCRRVGWGAAAGPTYSR